MKIGFTGTRKEITCEQHHALCRWVMDCQPRPTEFHHGCCVGADDEAMEVMDCHCKSAKKIAHPPENKSMIAGNSVEFSDVVLPAKPYLDRNRDIVDACEVLLACVDGAERLRSGTWSTIRYAQKVGRKVVVFWPDGTVEGD